MTVYHKVTDMLNDVDTFPDHTPAQAAAAGALIDATARAQAWPVADMVVVKAALGLLGGDQ